jgi:hypothetical protein
VVTRLNALARAIAADARRARHSTPELPVDRYENDFE